MFVINGIDPDPLQIELAIFPLVPYFALPFAGGT